MNNTIQHQENGDFTVIKGSQAPEPFKGLNKEIKETLLFFVQSDIQIYGEVTESTKEAFKKQGVKLPKELATIKKK